MKERKVHLYDTSGTITCKGIGLADEHAARPLEDDPLLITIYVEDATCDTCRLIWERPESAVG